MHYSPSNACFSIVLYLHNSGIWLLFVCKGEKISRKSIVPTVHKINLLSTYWYYSCWEFVYKRGNVVSWSYLKANISSYWSRLVHSKLCNRRCLITQLVLCQTYHLYRIKITVAQSLTFWCVLQGYTKLLPIDYVKYKLLNCYNKKNYVPQWYVETRQII